MTTDNAPTTALKDVAAGQRMMIVAILVNIAAYMLINAVGLAVGLVVGAVGLALALGGMLRTTRGLGFSAPRQVVYLVGLFLPMVSIAVLALASGEATKTLRGHGYKVGFFGASASEV